MNLHCTVLETDRLAVILRSRINFQTFDHRLHIPYTLKAFCLTFQVLLYVVVTKAGTINHGYRILRVFKFQFYTNGTKHVILYPAKMEHLPIQLLTHRKGKGQIASRYIPICLCAILQNLFLHPFLSTSKLLRRRV